MNRQKAKNRRHTTQGHSRHASFAFFSTLSACKTLTQSIKAFSSRVSSFFDVRSLTHIHALGLLHVCSVLPFCSIFLGLSFNPSQPIKTLKSCLVICSSCHCEYPFFILLFQNLFAELANQCVLLSGLMLQPAPSKSCSALAGRIMWDGR